MKKQSSAAGFLVAAVLFSAVPSSNHHEPIQASHQDVHLDPPIEPAEGETTTRIEVVSTASAVFGLNGQLRIRLGDLFSLTG